MNKKLILFLILLIPIAVIVLTIYLYEINKEDKKIIGSINLNDPANVDIIDIEKKEKESMKIKAVINEKEFIVSLENNDTVIDFLNMLPLTIDMSELNGNEKYYYLNNSITSNPKDVSRIITGDIMLYGDNCLVLFYKGFSTTYQYTKIGHIIDVNGIVNAVGKNNVTVKFQKIGE